MTKFMQLPSNEVKEVKKTVFTKALNGDLNIQSAINKPEYYDNIVHIGKDGFYGDVFKVWNNDCTENFVIFFGVKGDEEYITI